MSQTCAWAVDPIAIDHERLATFLPYELVEVAGHDWGSTRRVVINPVDVLEVRTTTHGTAKIAMVTNPELNVDDPASIHFLDRTNWASLREAPLYYTMEDFCVCRDAVTERAVVLAGCYRNDSAFVAKSDPSDTTVILFLVSGQNHTGDGEWRPDIRHVATVDYDHDGREEVFIQVCPGRDHEPRILFCVEVEELRVEWHLPVASSIRPGCLFACGDSAQPMVIFASYGPQNDVVDDHFDDLYGYLTVVDHKGIVIRNCTISDSFRTPVLGPAPDGGFYLYHSLPLGRDSLDRSKAGMHHWLSHISSDGDPILTVPLSNGLQSPFWFSDFDGNQISNLHALSLKGEVLVFYSTLKVIAQSNPTGLQMYLGRIPLEGRDRPGYVFNSRSGAQVYSAGFEKLASTEKFATEYRPLVTDPEGVVQEFIVTSRNSYSHISIRRRTSFDLARIAYWEYQVYVLSIFSSTLVALVFVNQFRRKTKRNLALIRQQKSKLEEVHAQLREAQDELVAQEKYRQAKDIAGGFAHEIRNALLPAEGALARLQQSGGPHAEQPLAPEEYALRAKRAVDRAVDLTRLISTYTRLEASKNAERVDLREVVDEVLDANKIRIADEGVTVENSLEAAGAITANRQHLFLCLNNLLLNSLDALTECADPCILIKSSADSETIDFSIRDNGVGIVAKDMPRVFDTFYSTKPSSGTGLGLAMARKTIEMYGGTIGISSEPGRWTRVDITFLPWLDDEQS